MRQLRVTKSITNRESQSLEKYLNEIAKTKLLSPEEEVELAKRIQSDGDIEAVEELTKANLRFVVSVAKQYQKQGLSLSDLINEGNAGMIKAAWRFDYTKGFKFISYAVWRVRQSIMQAIAENARVVRMPLNRVGENIKIHNVRESLYTELEREPTHEEIAACFDTLSTEDIDQIVATGKRHIPLDAPVSDADNTSTSYALIDLLDLSNIAAPDEKLQNEALQEDLARMLSMLTPRMQEVLTMYFGIGYESGYTLEDIGEHLGLTRERTRQIKDKAIRRLRATSKSKILKKYLGR